jgi:hypothetical protein
MAGFCGCMTPSCRCPTPPPSINGCTVMAFRPSEHGENNFVILVHKAHDTVTPWVTAVWSPRTGSEWVWGHYFSDPAKAVANYEAR